MNAGKRRDNKKPSAQCAPPLYQSKEGVFPMNDQTEQMEKVTQGLMQACEDINAACCKSMDTMMESTTAVTKGYEEFSRNLGQFMQESMSRAMNASKTMMSAKSIKQIAELQSEFMKEFFDSWMAGTGRLSEISARTTQEAFEPVTKQANTAFNKVADEAQRAAKSA
jgi:phasin family protein